VRERSVSKYKVTKQWQAKRELMRALGVRGGTWYDGGRVRLPKIPATRGRLAAYRSS
jgi:hypothetical protein